MIDIKEKYMCDGCHACYNVCPKDAINMEIDDEGFWYPKVNKETRATAIKVFFIVLILLNLFFILSM